MINLTGKELKRIIQYLWS